MRYLDMISNAGQYLWFLVISQLYYSKNIHVYTIFFMVIIAIYIFLCKFVCGAEKVIVNLTL